MKIALKHLTIILLMVSMSIISAAASDLPDMGSSSNRTLPLNIEQELGDNYMRLIRRDLDINSDPLVRTYINQLVEDHIAGKAENSRQLWQLLMLERSLKHLGVS